MASPEYDLYPWQEISDLFNEFWETHGGPEIEHEVQRLTEEAAS